MHTMNRRHFIALAANSLLLAGCAGNTATTAAGSGSAAEAAGSAAGSAAAVVVPPEAIAAGWTEEAWSDMYGMMHFMGYVDGGWDVDKYLESEAGQWYIANSANGFRRDLDHDDPEVNEKILSVNAFIYDYAENEFVDFSESERKDILCKMLDRWQAWHDSIVHQAKFLISKSEKANK